MNENKTATEEVRWRYDLLGEIGGKVVNREVNPNTLRDWRIYGGQQGIWVDKQRTAALTSDGNGLAVSLLHKGSFYPDDFGETGVIYHYPVTHRPASRDIGEIEAVKNCLRLRVPVFVITVSNADPSMRDVYFGYVTMWDDRAKIFIVEFGTDQVVIATDEQAEKPFELVTRERAQKYEVAGRPSQASFRIAVIRRYGAQCAVCEMAVIELLDAAHLVPKAESGSDDPRNGLPLCALHHRAFDKGLFSIRPDTSVVTKSLGPNKAELGITKDNLSHLKAKPHAAALNHCWDKWRVESGD